LEIFSFFFWLGFVGIDFLSGVGYNDARLGVHAIFTLF
jgi:hypothetical protein